MKKWMFMTALTASATLASGAPVDFAETIKPIFDKHCVECHGGEEPEHDIALDNRESALNRRRLIVPGEPDRSELLKVMTLPLDDEHHMPPKDSEQMTAEEIEHVRVWLKEGAFWPGGKVNFWTEVKPILDQNCVGCHSGEEAEDGVHLDDKVQAFAKRGLIVAGQPDRSELVQVLSLPMDDEHHMPPKDEKQLLPAQIQTLTAWVEQGAVWPDTVDYASVIEPLLTSRCYRCHGTGRARGGLRMIDQASATTGGETGPAIVPGDPDKSLALQYVMLPADHEKHMPQRGQLSDNEIALLKLWIQQGASFEAAATE